MNYLIYLLYKLLRFICSIISSRAQIKLGIWFGHIIKILSKKRLRITLENLENAFPEKNKSEITQLAIDCYENLGTTFMEILNLDKLSKQELEQKIQYENIELIDDLYSKDKGLILMSAHFGNWEYLAFSCGLYTQIPVNIVVKPQSNEYIDREINKIRTSSNNKVFSSYKAAREMLTLIKEKKVVALIADQTANKSSNSYSNFFSRNVPSYDAPAKLALKYKAPIVIGFAVRGDDQKYRVKLEELDHSDLENSEENVKVLTQRYMTRIEEEIRKTPHLWAWQHRRWKHAKN